MPAVLDIGYSLSPRFPDPPQTDYRAATVRELRHDLFCGDIHLTETASGRELATRRGWLPVLDFAWALCDTAEALDADPLGSRSPGPHHAELDFPETADRLLLTRQFGSVDIAADWEAPGPRPTLTVRHAELRSEARDFLQDLVADLADAHEELLDNPVVWELRTRFPRV